MLTGTQHEVHIQEQEIKEHRLVGEKGVDCVSDQRKQWGKRHCSEKLNERASERGLTEQNSLGKRRWVLPQRIHFGFQQARGSLQTADASQPRAANTAIPSLTELFGLGSQLIEYPSASRFSCTRVKVACAQERESKPSEKPHPRYVTWTFRHHWG